MSSQVSFVYSLCFQCFPTVWRMLQYSNIIPAAGTHIVHLDNIYIHIYIVCRLSTHREPRFLYKCGISFSVDSLQSIPGWPGVLRDDEAGPLQPGPEGWVDLLRVRRLLELHQHRGWGVQRRALRPPRQKLAHIFSRFEFYRQIFFIFG